MMSFSPRASCAGEGGQGLGSRDFTIQDPVVAQVYYPGPGLCRLSGISHRQEWWLRGTPLTGNCRTEFGICKA
jgi:hypothetical protein